MTSGFWHWNYIKCCALLVLLKLMFEQKLWKLNWKGIYHMYMASVQELPTFIKNERINRKSQKIVLVKNIVLAKLMIGS